MARSAEEQRVAAARVSAHIDEILAVLERLYAQAVVNPTSGAVEFLDRLAWLAPLLTHLE